MTLGSPQWTAVPFVATDAEAERVFGPWGRGLVSAVERFSPPVTVFTAGACSRCGGACLTQMVRVSVNAAANSEALCPTCMGRDVDGRDPSWFAAEERRKR